MWYASFARSDLLPLTVRKAFLVAWGGTAAQAGRLTGFLILSLELKKFVGCVEIYAFWMLLPLLLGEHVETYRPA